ncbi:MAG: dTDP-glucose 4,6-dehydratase [Anaerocolumna sp.]|nr:dTDP-glucose 4,6-dehydratase [Anaerocolumna sp.]
MKTYLVTGGAGFIGSNFINHLFNTYQSNVQVINLDLLTYAGNPMNLKDLQDNEKYHFIQGDICDTKLVREIFSKYSVDYVVHFAAESHVDRSISDSEIFVKTNVLGTLTLLNAAKKSWETNTGFLDGKRFLYVSTDEVYGALGKDGYFTEETPISPRNPYSASKASADMMVKAFYETHNFPAVITRCSNNYGPHQFPEKLIPLYIYNGTHNKKLPVYGDGLAIRDWLYVMDHCSAIDLVLNKGKLGEVYNVGGHNEKTTLEIAEVIIDVLSKDYNINITKEYIDYVPDRKGHDRRYAIDPIKIKKELNWSPSVNFTEGIKKTIEWYMSHPDYLETIISGDYKKLE